MGEARAPPLCGPPALVPRATCGAALRPRLPAPPRGGPPFLARASHAELLPLATSPFSSLSLAPDVELRPAAAKPVASGRPSRLRAHLCSCLAPSQWPPAAQLAPGAHSRSCLPPSRRPPAVRVAFQCVYARAEPVAFSCLSRPQGAFKLVPRAGLSTSGRPSRGGLPKPPLAAQAASGGVLAQCRTACAPSRCVLRCAPPPLLAPLCRY